MEGWSVPVTEILSIQPHPNADRLEIATVYGFNVIVRKEQYKVGDWVFYVPIDSVLSPKLENHLFPPESKLKLSKSRIKQIKLRKIASQGMLIPCGEVSMLFQIPTSKMKLDKDFSKELGIVKYEPPVKVNVVGASKTNRRKKTKENLHFKKYNGLTNIKWNPTLFREGELVVYQEKIHGTNARAGILPVEANTFFRKIKKFFGLLPKFEFCYGSNNVQLQCESKPHKGFYGEDVYGRVFKEMDVQSKLHEGETIFGEIYGEGIQKNYNYGLKGEQKFVLFDVRMPNGTWLCPSMLADYANDRGFDIVPEIYCGPFVDLDHVKGFTLGRSVFNKKQQIREGVVVKSIEQYTNVDGSRRSLKCISEKYLEKDNSDFH